MEVKPCPWPLSFNQIVLIDWKMPRQDGLSAANLSNAICTAAAGKPCLGQEITQALIERSH